MGVSFYHCDICGECLYEEYVQSCETCGTHICEHCHNGNTNDDGEVLEESCNHCNGTTKDPWDIIDYLFEHHIERDRDTIMDEYEVHKTMDKGK